MNEKIYNILNDVTFKTQVYQKNFNFLGIDNIISENDGIITRLRTEENKPPIIIGEFGFSSWNINVAKIYDINIDQVILDYSKENSYGELLHLRKNGSIDFHNINRLYILHSFILHEDYRKYEITEELFEMFYRVFLSENDMLLALVMPFQYNKVDFDYYYKNKKVLNLTSIKPRKQTEHSASDYYSLNNFLDNNDYESDSYRLFALASRCGLIRIGDGHLFKFTPDKTIERLKNKKNIENKIEKR